MKHGWGECFFNHFEHFLGTPSGRYIYEKNEVDPTIQVLVYDNVLPTSQTFCSLGFSHYMQEVADTSEICVVAEAGWQEIPYIMASALFYMIDQRMPIGWGVSIGGIEVISPDFVREFDKHALYITNNYLFPEQFNTVVCDNHNGHIFVGFFISQSEHSYVVRHGAQAFETLLATQRVDPIAITRRSCI